MWKRNDKGEGLLLKVSLSDYTDTLSPVMDATSFRWLIHFCKELHAEVMQKTEYRIEGLMESLDLKTQSTRERQRESKTQKT